MSADFIPNINRLSPFRFWCQKTLPLVYDDSLSYYELLCKVVDYINKLITDEQQLVTAYSELQDYVNNYFDNLDVTEEINNKLDQMAEDGSLTELISVYLDPFIEAQEAYNAQTRTELEAYSEETRLSVNERLDNQDVEIQTIRNLVGSPLVAATVSAMTETDRIYVYTGNETGYTAGHWYYYNGTAWVSGGVYQASLTINTDPTLSVAGSAADAKAVGDADKIINLNHDLGMYGDSYVINYSSLPYVTGFMKTDGTIDPISSHKCVHFSADKIKYIKFVTARVIGNYPYFVIKDKTGTVVYTFMGASSALVSHPQYVMLEGIKEGCTIYCNWFNSDNTYFSSIEVTLAKENKYTGLNMYNKYDTVDGYFFNYDSGLQQINQNYCFTTIRVKANQTYTINRASHICFKNANGAYISGVTFIGSAVNNFTTPANTVMAIVSVRIDQKSSCQVEEGQYYSGYHAFYNKFEHDFSDTGRGTILADSDFTQNTWITFIDIPSGIYLVYISTAGSYGFPIELGNSFELEVTNPRSAGSYGWKTFKVAANNGYTAFCICGNSTSHTNLPAWFTPSSGDMPDVFDTPQFNVPLSPVKLLLLGDSITQGAGASGLSGTETFTTSLGTKTIYSQGNSWALKLAAYLSEQYPNITVLNHGWGGITWEELAGAIDEFVPNDTTHCIIGLGVNSEGETTFTGSIQTVINYLTARNIKVFAWTNWIGSHTGQSNINTAGRVQAANVAGFNTVNIKPLPVYSKALRYMAENNISQASVMETGSTVHPNDTGHEIIYRIIREGFGF